MKATLNATAIRALLLLALPSTRLLICNDECYIIRKPRPRHISAKAYETLLYAGFITRPQTIGGNLAECVITPEGQAIALKIREEMSGYYQLCLFEEEEEAAEAKETQTPLSLFDDTEGAA